MADDKKDKDKIHKLALRGTSLLSMMWHTTNVPRLVENCRGICELLERTDTIAESNSCCSSNTQLTRYCKGRFVQAPGSLTDRTDSREVSTRQKISQRKTSLNVRFSVDLTNQ